MPPRPRESSTARRHRLSDFVNQFGETMVQKCATCVKHNRVCRVHVRSGKCSECLRRGQRCDVKVTQSEFKRLLAAKEKLQQQIRDSRAAQDSAMKAHEKALEDLRVARAREERLRRQMDLLDRRAEEAISVEERSIEEQESEEGAEPSILFQDPPEGLALNLSPQTWGAFDDLPLDFWDVPGGIPSVSVGNSQGSSLVPKCSPCVGSLSILLNTHRSCCFFVVLKSFLPRIPVLLLLRSGIASVLALSGPLVLA